MHTTVAEKRLNLSKDRFKSLPIEKYIKKKK